MTLRPTPRRVAAGHQRRPRARGRGALLSVALRRAEPGATLPFYTVVDCHWLAFLRDLHSDLAVIAVILSQVISVAHG
jgi:hypothetical protein